MPKETIQYEDPTYHPAVVSDQPGKTVHTTEFSIHWTPGDGGVIQLGVELDIDMVLEHCQLVKQHSPTDKTVMFYSPALSRAGAQRLIRFGRKARDAVHGADE